MQNTDSFPRTVILTVALALHLGALHAQNYATFVAGYAPGAGVAAAYTNSSRALGMPTASLDYQPLVDPFNPAYASSNLVTLGAGGFLTLGFSTPILNDLAHPFGVDLVLFGNDGFNDTNWPAGVTDGQTLSQAFGQIAVSRVLVSADNSIFYELRGPGWASTEFDRLFPADAAGHFGLPVNPALRNADFAGLNLAGIRALYAGSGGGTGYDLSWAVDGSGQPVSLSSISYVRIEVAAGKVDVDAAMAAVPEPTTAALGVLAFAALVAARHLRRRVG